MVTLRCALVLPLAASACFSGPLLPRLPAKELASIERPLGSPQAVHLQCVQSGTEFELRCQQAVAEVAKLLALSSWFTTLEASPEDASLVIPSTRPLLAPSGRSPPLIPGSCHHCR